MLHLCACMFSTIITANIESIVDNDELIEFIIDFAELFIWHIVKTIQVWGRAQVGVPCSYHHHGMPRWAFPIQ